MKTKILLLVVFALVSGLLFGCDKTEKSLDNSSQTKDQNVSELSGAGSNVISHMKLADNETNTSSIQIQDRMIVKSGQIQIEADNYDIILNEISKLTGEYKGYIINSTSSLTLASKKQGNVNVKIPAASFDEFVRKISGLGKVMSENISSHDITDEFIDTQARLNTQKELEKRLLDLLNDRTGKLSDVIEVENKLSDVRSKIESAEGKINFLKNQAEYSTLQISIFEPSILNTSSGGGFFYEIGQSISKGLTGFTEVTGGLIAGLIALSPVIIFFAVLFFVVRKIWRKRKMNKVAVSV